MRPQINYRVVSRAHARIKELAGAAAASTLVSILTTAVSPRITESWKSHLLFIVASGVLGLILPCFTSRVVRLDAGWYRLRWARLRRSGAPTKSILSTGPIQCDAADASAVWITIFEVSVRCTGHRSAISSSRLRCSCDSSPKSVICLSMRSTIAPGCWQCSQSAA
jgi:hypothetical protein